MSPVVGYAGVPRTVRFLARPNRYLARVRSLAGGRPFLAHVPNPGRMEELLVPGTTVGYVVPAPGAARRTSFDLVSVRHGRSLVSIDARVGNRLAARALSAGLLPEVGRGTWRAEYPWEGGRIDFALPGPSRDRPAALLEVKCSNLRVGSTALFPDAPTERGRRHVEALTRAARRGIPSAVLFLVQRHDVRAFTANRALDPKFARALDRARARGVRLRAQTTRIGPGTVAWGSEIP